MLLPAGFDVVLSDLPLAMKISLCFTLGHTQNMGLTVFKQ